MIILTCPLLVPSRFVAIEALGLVIARLDLDATQRAHEASHVAQDKAAGWLAWVPYAFNARYRLQNEVRAYAAQIAATSPIAARQTLLAQALSWLRDPAMYGLTGDLLDGLADRMMAELATLGVPMT